MCGIAGMFDLRQPTPDSQKVLQNMLAAIQYRGPDESGIYLHPKLAMGNVRLSIIGISTGQQPMGTPNGRYWIVFNGEIFNYIELKHELGLLGHHFRTDSDTEVLLNAYLQYGEDCLNRLNGQFVFAIWDELTHELFLARDRVGIRPLFYTWQNNTFVFGSEIKCLAEYPGIPIAFDPGSLSQVFSLWTTVTPATVFKNILELPPGHRMKISAEGAEIRPFWKLAFPTEPDQVFKGTIQDASEELHRLLRDSVRIRLRADVPVAAYLSGGLDSSATTALIREVQPESLQTFSIGFQDDEFDESSYQQEVSEYLDTRHTAFSCTNAEIGELFPTVVWHTEIPVLRTAPVPMYCLSKKVRESQIKVVVTGEGADEILAGYDIFKEAIIREFWSRQPDSKYRPLLLNKLYPYLKQFQGRNKTMLKFFYGKGLADTTSPFYSHALRWNNTATLRNFLLPGLQEASEPFDPGSHVASLLPPGFHSYGRLAQAQWLETVLFMSGYLLSSQGDRMAMANSVEGRYPFLDYRVIEFASSLPPEFKMNGLNEKYILKRIMAGRLPSRVLKRPKQAYRAPIAGSFFKGPASAYVNELLSPKSLEQTGLFTAEAVQKLTDRMKQSQLPTEIDNMALSGIISTLILHHQYVARDRFRPSPSRLRNCNTIIDRTKSILHESNP